jgi:purine-cytosine permease-like protein
MEIKITKWSLMGPSAFILLMVINLLNPYVHIFFHILEFILIIIALALMNYLYIKQFNEKKKDTAKT